MSSRKLVLKNNSFHNLTGQKVYSIIIFKKNGACNEVSRKDVQKFTNKIVSKRSGCSRCLAGCSRCYYLYSIDKDGKPIPTVTDKDDVATYFCRDCASIMCENIKREWTCENCKHPFHRVFSNTCKGCRKFEKQLETIKSILGRTRIDKKVVVKTIQKALKEFSTS